MTVASFAGRDGILLSADVLGPDDGLPVVLMHGGGQTRHSWAGTARVLADRGWRVVSFDLRGHGDSAWDPEGDYTLNAFAADVTAVARSFDRRPALVGASLGGITSMVAIADAGGGTEVASSLTLVDVAHRIEVDGRDRIGAFMTAAPDGFASLDEAADAIAAYNPHRPRPKDLSGLKKNLRQRDDGRWAWHWDPAFVHGRFGSSDETRTSLIRADRLQEAAEALRLPTLLVRGRSSDLLSEAGAEDFLRIVPHAEFADVAGAGHMVAGDRNDVFNQAILQFLADHPPA